MKIDLVHDIQKTYRTILSCFASPGGIGDLSAETALLDIGCPVNPGFLLLALTLLDAETTLSVASADSSTDESFFSRMTNTRTASPAKAAFLFVCRDTEASLLEVQRGTLVDPHLGATVILEVGSIHDVAEKESTGAKISGWRLSGPGIKSSVRIGLSSPDGALLERALLDRNESCLEFPLGLDMIFIDAKQKIICIPRTTILEEM